MKLLRLAVLMSACLCFMTSAQLPPPVAFPPFSETMNFLHPEDPTDDGVTAVLTGSGSHTVAWRLSESNPGQLQYDQENDRFEYMTPFGPRAVLQSGERIPIREIGRKSKTPSLPSEVRVEGNSLVSRKAGKEWTYRLPDPQRIVDRTLQADPLGNVYFQDDAYNYYSLQSDGNVRFVLTFQQLSGNAECQAGSNGEAVCVSDSFGIIGIRGKNPPVRLMIDGRERFFRTPSVIRAGTTFVPMRSLFEALGATVSWNEKNRTVNAVKGNRKVRLTIGSKTAYVNGKPVKLNLAPIGQDGTTLVPLRFVGEALGRSVLWEGAVKTIQIVSRG